MDAVCEGQEEPSSVKSDSLIHLIGLFDWFEYFAKNLRNSPQTTAEDRQKAPLRAPLDPNHGSHSHHGGTDNVKIMLKFSGGASVPLLGFK